METSKLCRICLAKEVRMYDLVNTYLQETYESLTAMQFEMKDSRPSQLCYICYAQLQTCHKLRSKSLHNEELFRQVLDSSELKLAPLNNVTPLLTIQFVTQLSIVPVSFDTTDTNVKNETDDEPSLDCSNIIDNVQVKSEYVEGTEDIFDTDEDRIIDDNNENKLSEAEDTILTLSAISNSGCRTPVDSCPKTDQNDLQRLELTNIGTTPIVQTQLEKRTVSGKEVVNGLSEEHIDKTVSYSYLSTQIHTDVTDRPYKCDICGKFFTRKQYLLRHARLHTDIKAYACDICGKGFKRKDNLSSHMLTHTGIRAYACDICGKVFKGKEQLSFHNLTHTGIRAYACDVCGKGFTSSAYLKKHSLTHTLKKVYPCDICGIGFKRKDNLSCHMLTHTGIRAYVCDICGKEFKRKGSLSSHLLIHTGKREYVCNICGKDFKRKDYLWSHTRTHTGMRSYYVCDICGKDFKRKDQLSQHILLHIGIRAYACDICGKSFTSSVYLKKHVRRHTSKKAHTCDICGKISKCDELPKHICTHTGVKPYTRDICAKY